MTNGSPASWSTTSFRTASFSGASSCWFDDQKYDLFFAKSLFDLSIVRTLRVIDDQRACRPRRAPAASAELGGGEHGGGEQECQPQPRMTGELSKRCCMAPNVLIRTSGHLLLVAKARAVPGGEDAPSELGQGGAIRASAAQFSPCRPISGAIQDQSEISHADGPTDKQIPDGAGRCPEHCGGPRSSVHRTCAPVMTHCSIRRGARYAICSPRPTSM